MEELLRKIQITSTTGTVKERSFKERKVVLYIKPKLSSYLRFKYFFEYLIALVTVIVSLPLLVIVGLAVKLDSRGSIFFKQTRYGYCGIPFSVYKFRTMVNGAHLMQNEISHLNEMDGGKLFKSNNDPRVTKLGKFLRKTSIDELPQLLNILRGEMTIIGPRPISTPLNEYDNEDLKRFKVRPGLGCIWQAYFRGETDFKTWMKTDSIYVDEVSPVLDFKLLFIIAKNVLRTKGAR